MASKKNTKQKNKTEAKDAAVAFTDHAWEEYSRWAAEDPKVLDSINSLIKECRRTPFQGTGKPEPLKYDLTGYWSRRITGEHRLVYMFEAGTLYIVSCRYHYE